MTTSAPRPISLRRMGDTPGESASMGAAPTGSGRAVGLAESLCRAGVGAAGAVSRAWGAGPASGLGVAWVGRSSVETVGGVDPAGAGSAGWVGVATGEGARLLPAGCGAVGWAVSISFAAPTPGEGVPAGGAGILDGSLGAGDAIPGVGTPALGAERAVSGAATLGGSVGALEAVPMVGAGAVRAPTGGGGVWGGSVGNFAGALADGAAPVASMAVPVSGVPAA